MSSMATQTKTTDTQWTPAYEQIRDPLNLTWMVDGRGSRILSGALLGLVPAPAMGVSVRNKRQAPLAEIITSSVA